MVNPFSDNNEIKYVYDNTEIHKKPLTGIVEGFHILPYILVGPHYKNPRNSVKLSGEIKVSPKLIFTLTREEKKMEDIFEEEEPFMDKELVGRIFQMSSPKLSGLEFKGSGLTVETSPKKSNDLLQNVVEDLSRGEIINTGVVYCPRPRYYPVSLEKFISTILDREFQ